ncbi:hypothetical protein HRbin32_01332 [bacterium HR32]|nr:hypothetical protein HRbin32_01332 [bacterium HR32]
MFSRSLARRTRSASWACRRIRSYSRLRSASASRRSVTSTMTPRSRVGRPASCTTVTMSCSHTTRPSAAVMRYSNSWSSHRSTAALQKLTAQERSSGCTWRTQKSGSSSQQATGYPSTRSACGLTYVKRKVSASASHTIPWMECTRSSYLRRRSGAPGSWRRAGGCSAQATRPATAPRAEAGPRAACKTSAPVRPRLRRSGRATVSPARATRRSLRARLARERHCELPQRPAVTSRSGRPGRRRAAALAPLAWRAPSSTLEKSTGPRLGTLPGFAGRSGEWLASRMR